MPLGRTLVILGLVLVAAGVVVTLAGRSPIPFGRLPGDIRIQAKNSSFYFPLTTCLIVSAAVTLAMWLLRR
jgi:formate hydrogenlyase subunit 3/multisubunit Na+/H+ antiporter MnhD subunit